VLTSRERLQATLEHRQPDDAETTRFRAIDDSWGLANTTGLGLGSWRVA
jgi:hypothetical protein